YRNEVPGMSTTASIPFCWISCRAFSWRSARSCGVIGCAWPFKDASFAMAAGSGLQLLETSSAEAMPESAVMLPVMAVDCKKRRRENMEVPQMSAVHYCMLAEFQDREHRGGQLGLGGHASVACASQVVETSQAPWQRQ